MKTVGICGSGKKELTTLATSIIANNLLSSPYEDIDELYRNDFYDFIDMPKIKEVRHVPQYARKKEQPRNEKCNCGSGLKYKKCCGK